MMAVLPYTEEEAKRRVMEVARKVQRENMIASERAARLIFGNNSPALVWVGSWEMATLAMQKKRGGIGE